MALVVKKGVENGGEVALLDAAAGVFDGEANARKAGRSAFEDRDLRHGLVAGGGEGEETSLRHGIGGIEQQVDDDLAEFHHVEMDAERNGGQVGVHLNAAGQGFADQFDQVGGDVVEVVKIALAGLAEVEVDHAFDQLAGLEGVLLDQAQTLVEGMVGSGLFEELFAQGMDAGDDVGEVMRHAQGEDGEGFLPGGGGEAAFGDGLAGDIEPDDFETQEESVAADGGLAAFENVGDAPGEGVADAIRGGDGLAGMGGAFALLLQFDRIGLVDQLPEKLGAKIPVLRRNAGEFLDVGAGEGDAEIRPLAEDDAGPAPGHAFQAGFGAEEAHEHLAAGGGVVEVFVPGGFLQFVEGRQGGIEPDKPGLRAAHDFEEEPLGRAVRAGGQLQFQTVKRLATPAHPCQGLAPVGGERGQGLPKGKAHQIGGGLFEPTAKGFIDFEDTPVRGEQSQAAFQPASRRNGRQGGRRVRRPRQGFWFLKVRLQRVCC